MRLVEISSSYDHNFSDSYYSSNFGDQCVLVVATRRKQILKLRAPISSSSTDTLAF